MPQHKRAEEDVLSDELSMILVTCRKISGGTRSPAGTATKMTLATLFGTWRLQGLDPLAECRALLASPQL